VYQAASQQRVTKNGNLLSFFLLSSNDKLTPLPSDELTFMQARLGKKAVSLDLDLTHDHIEVKTSFTSET